VRHLGRLCRQPGNKLFGQPIIALPRIGNAEEVQRAAFISGDESVEDRRDQELAAIVRLQRVLQGAGNGLLARVALCLSFRRFPAPCAVPRLVAWPNWLASPGSKFTERSAPPVQVNSCCTTWSMVTCCINATMSANAS
jgi:hypothetical protein